MRRERRHVPLNSSYASTMTAGSAAHVSGGRPCLHAVILFPFCEYQLCPKEESRVYDI